MEQMVKIELNIAPVISLAAWQSSISFLQQLRIQSLSTQPLIGVTLTIDCEPEFAQPLTLLFERISPQESIRREPSFVVRPEFLAELSESILGIMHVSVRIGGDLLHDERITVRLLPPNHWPGLSCLPEITACFILPNEVAVNTILSEAANILRTNGESRGLNGYQSSSVEYVGIQAGAIFQALKRKQISYISPPSSFEDDGQKVRFPREVLDMRLGTCFDLSLFFAACLEQAGLNPLIVFKNGHALVGLWLFEGSSLSSPFTDDCESFAKQVDASKVICIETTMVTRLGEVMFREAERAGRVHVCREHGALLASEGLVGIFDVLAARKMKLRPLSTKVDYLERETLPFQLADENPNFESLALPGLVNTENYTQEISPDNDKPSKRLERWKAKLLDLTLRNRLLNFKSNKNCARLVIANPADFEDKLASNKNFRFVPLQDFSNRKDPQSKQNVSVETAKRYQELWLQENYEKNKIALWVPNRKNKNGEEKEVNIETHLLEIFRSARTAEEESGSSSLFVSLGTLIWNETISSEKELRAPILLVPVELARSSAKAGLNGYALKARDEDTRVNPTLIEKLRRDFGVAFDIFEQPPADDSGVDVLSVFRQFKELTINRKGWRVEENDVWLGEFSFRKYLMWKDLQERTLDLKKNPLVDHLLEKPGEAISFQGNFVSNRDLDKDIHPKHIIAPLPADASQLRAICSAAEGKSFVLEGPPGTGKSQTIANMITNCLANGKRVLFVSEKSAALKVVAKRLEDIGLASFCLELHSDKSRKSDVLERLRESTQVKAENTESAWEESSRIIEKQRCQLNAYAQAIHERHALGFSFFDALSFLIENKNIPLTEISRLAPNGITIDEYRKLQESAAKIEGLAAVIDWPLNTHGLNGLGCIEWSAELESKLLLLCSNTHPLISSVIRILEKITDLLKIGSAKWNNRQIDSLVKLGNTFLNEDHYALKAAILLIKNQISPNILSKLRRSIERRNILWSTLKPRWEESLLGLNTDLLLLEWKKSSLEWWPRNIFAKRSFRKNLGVHLILPRLVSLADIEILNIVKEIRDLDEDIRQNSVLVAPNMEKIWAGLETDVSKLLACEKIVLSIDVSVKEMELSLTIAAGVLSEALEAAFLSSENREALLEQFDELGKLWNDCKNGLKSIESIGCIQEEFINGSFEACGISKCRDFCRSFEREIKNSKFSPWCIWQKSRIIFVSLGFGCWIKEIESGNVARNSIELSFEASIRKWWLNGIIAAKTELASFSGASHNEIVKKFKNMDTKHWKLSMKVCQGRLSERVPHG